VGLAITVTVGHFSRHGTQLRTCRPERVKKNGLKFYILKLICHFTRMALISLITCSSPIDGVHATVSTANCCCCRQHHRSLLLQDNGGQYLVEQKNRSYKIMCICHVVQKIQYSDWWTYHEGNHFPTIYP
jgi:hypothetical protein